MMTLPRLRSRVKDYSTTTGTGDFFVTVPIPVSYWPYHDFLTALADDDRVYYVIEHQSLNEWEIGVGQWDEPGLQLERINPILNSNGTATALDFSAGVKHIWVDVPDQILPQGMQHLAQGRLTLTTGVPITTADVTGAATLYYTPYNGNLIGLYDGYGWRKYEFTEQSASLASLLAGKNYDVFYDWNGGAPALAFTVWTNDTTRATDLVLQDGVYVKTGDTEQRYLGTIRMVAGTGAGDGTTDDSILRRYVWNMYNRVEKHLFVDDTTDSWNYTTATWRQARATSSNKVELVLGLADQIVNCEVKGLASNTTGALVATGVGLDSTSANSAQVFGQGVVNNGNSVPCRYSGFPAVGYHYLAWLEISQATGTTTWYGDVGFTDIVQSGLIATTLF